MRKVMAIALCLASGACATYEQSMGTGAGVVGGAVVAGPVGAVVGGVAGAMVTAPGGPISPAASTSATLPPVPPEERG